MTSTFMQFTNKALSALRKPLAYTMLLGTLGSQAYGQIAMTRSTFAGTYSALSLGGGATAATTAQADDATATAIPIGFTFTYLGASHSTLNICSNGWVSLTSTSSSAANTNLSTTTAPNSAIAPWWDDLSPTAVLYQTTGSAGSRVFTAQWTTPSYYVTGTTRVINFQVKLYETTNVIEFWYDTPIAGVSDVNESASIGLKSATGGNGQYLDAITGSAFTANTSMKADRWPARNFRFTPGAPTAVAAGTYNVGVGQTYPNLNEAFADLNHKGIAGAVTLNLTDAQYDGTAGNGGHFFPLALGPVAGTSASNTITITKSGAPAVITYEGISVLSGGISNQTSTSAMTSSSEAILALVGADYVTLNNLDVRSSSAGVVDYGIALINSSAVDGATNNTIQNVSVSLSRTNTNSRGFLTNVPTSPSSAAGANSNNTFRDFTIKSVYAGIQMTGNASFPDLNNTITNSVCTNYNTIGDAGTANDIGGGAASTQSFGIRMSNQSGFTVRNNNIRNVGVSGTIADGILVDLFQGTATLAHNKIQTIRNNSTSSTSAVSGIRASQATSGTHTLRIYNNSISELLSSFTGTATATRGMRGIMLNSAGGGTTTQVYEVYNNSVSIDGSATPNISSSCLEHGGGGGPVYRLGNNVFANFTAAQGATARHACLFSTSATTFGPAGSSSNNNVLYIANDAGVSGFTGVGNTTTYNTIANWTTAMSPAGLEAVSIAVNPTYLNNISDLHASNLALNGVGMAPPAYITQDLDCATRTPDNDLGAYILNSCTGTPTAGSITGVTNVCSGTGTTLTLSGASSGAGITYQWASSTTAGGPYGTLLGTSNTQATGNLSATTYYVVTVTCVSSGQSVVTAEKTLTVDPTPAPIVTPSSAVYCAPGGAAVALTASGGTTYAWSPAAGLNTTSGASVNASPSATTTYTVTATTGSCSGTANVTVTVNEVPVLTSVTATPSDVCMNGSSTLAATAANTTSYAVASIPYAATATPGSGVTTLTNDGVAGVALSSGDLDDGGWSNQALPFAFSAFGTVYNSIAISSNGFIWLGSGAPSTFTGYNNTLPSTSAARPCIGAIYGDLDFSTFGKIEYFTTGTAPNRKFIVNWTDGEFYDFGGSLGVFDVQLVLSEGTNMVEVHTNNSSADNPASQGLQNAGGTSAFTVTGRNNATWAVSTPDAYRFSPNGGSATYAWTPATFLSGTTGSPVTASNITSNITYTVAATINGCTVSDDVTINVGVAPTVDATVSAPTCAGGVITLDAVTTGATPFNYVWSDAATTASIAGDNTVGNKSYSVTATDNCGVTVSDIVNYTVNPLPSVVATPSTATICLPGGSAVALAATGATTYAWSPASGLSATTGASVNANPSVSTTYTVTGTDGNGCVNTATAVVNVAQTVATAAAATPATICAGSPTALAANASIALGAFCASTHTNGCSGDNITNVTLGSINNNTTGCGGTSHQSYFAPSPTTTTTMNVGSNYSLSVSFGTDVNQYFGAWIDYNQSGTFETSEFLGASGNAGASGTIAIVFTVPAGAYNGLARLRIVGGNDSPVANNEACGVSSSTWGETQDYDVTIANGTVIPFTYAWSPAASLNNPAIGTPTATPMATTSYTVTATLAGCSASSNVNVTVNSVTATTSVVHPCSNTTTGSATATPTSGLAPHTFAWSNGQTDATATALTAGTYTVTVGDANGCFVTVTATLTVPPALTATITKTNMTCYGVNDGTLSVVAGGGTPSYTYLWNSGQTTPALTGMPQASYSVTITDANNCTVKKSALVVSPSVIVISKSTTPTSCTGNDGTATVSATGGTGAKTFAWSNGASGASVTGLAAGNYTVTATDASGCQRTATVVVNNGCMMSINKTDVICNGGCNGTADVVMNGGGTAPYTYQWSNNAGAATTASLTGLCAGNYTVTVTDALGAVNIGTVSITQPAVYSVTINKTNATCNGVCDGTATAVVSGSVAPYTYQWSNGSTTNSTTGLCQGTHYVTITAANGCVTVKSFLILQNVITLTMGSTPSSCAVDGTASVTTGGTGMAPYTYMWSNAGTTNSITGLPAGNYRVTVTDVNGCVKTGSVNVTNTCTMVAGGNEENTNGVEEELQPMTATQGNGLADLTMNDAMTVYPNPNTGDFFVKIELGMAQDATVRIQDVLGRTLHEEQLQGQFFQLPIQAREWSDGAYLVQLITNSNQISTKVVITRQ